MKSEKIALHLDNTKFIHVMILFFTAISANEQGQTQVIIIAGTDRGTKTSSVAYDPTGKTSCMVNDVKGPARIGSQATGDTGQTLESNIFPLLCGGCNGTCEMDSNEVPKNVLNSCLKLTSDGTWIPNKKDMLENRVDFSMNIFNNTAISIGGRDGVNKYGTNTIESFDFVSQIWYLLPNIPVRIYGHCSVIYNQALLIIMGGVQNGKVNVNF